jgi:hypothetical protein
MTTLLQTYIEERSPSSWKGLFKEATNIGFMVKYMVRAADCIALIPQSCLADHG